MTRALRGAICHVIDAGGCRQAVFRRVVDAATVVAERMSASRPRGWVVTGFITPHTEVVVTDVQNEATLLL